MTKCAPSPYLVRPSVARRSFRLSERLIYPCRATGDANRILALPDMKERETTLGYRFIGGAPDKLAAMLRHEIAKWADVAKSASLKSQ
jgi:hypothetical protein